MTTNFTNYRILILMLFLLFNIDSSTVGKDLFEVEENNETCSNWTSLTCSDIIVPFPYTLEWSTSEGGLNDAANTGTGFTAVAPPSNRQSVDGTPSNADVPGFEPSMINVNTSTGNLSLTTNKGIFFRSSNVGKGNSQINSLAVGIDAASQAKTIQTKLVSLPAPGSRDYQQAGLWFGLGESDYVKLVVISHLYGDERYEVQLLYELNDVYQQEETNRDVVAAGGDIILQMILDPANNKIVGFYSTDNGATFKSVGPGITVSSSLFSGTNLSNSLSSNVSFGGIYATHRNSNNPLVYNFANFSIKEVEGVVENQRPTLNPINNPAPLALNAGEQTIELTGISAGEGETQNLTVTATSSNPNIIPNPTVTYTSPNPTGTISYTPVADASGIVEITVTVRDEGSNIPPNENSISRTFTVYIGDAPTLDAIVFEGPLDEDSEAQSVELTGITTGAAGNRVLSVTATSDNVDLIPNPTVSYTSPNTTGAISFKPLENAYGTANITVTVTHDGPGPPANVNSFSQTFPVTVKAINDAPYINEIATQSTDIGVPIGPVGFTIGDVDNDPKQLTITAQSGNQNMVPNDNIEFGGAGANRTFTITPIGEQNGPVLITLTISDGELQSERAFLLNVGEVTSVSENEWVKQVKIYPNPSINNVEVELTNQLMGEVSLQVIDLSGKIHKFINFNKQEVNTKYNFSINGLSKGVYVLQVNQQGYITTKKLIKL